jgi:imidazolonepropionase-like amidohydrolase
MSATFYLVAAAAATAAQPQAAGTLAIRGATVIDTVGTRDIDNAVVIVRGGRIDAVGRGLAVPRGAKVIDGRGKYLIPALIDGHVHFFQSGGLHTRPDALDLRGEVTYAQEVAAIRRRLPDTLARYTRAGVAGAVDMGGPFWNFELRDLAGRRANAPRLWVAGPLLSPYQPAALVTEDPPILKTDTADQARAQARAQVARRPDLLKFWYIVGPAGPEAARPQLRAMIAEARRARLPAAVHATELETARAAVAEGADILVHSVDDKEVDEAFVAAMRKRGTVYVPTLIVMGRYAAVFGGRNPLTSAERAAGQFEVVRSFDGLAERKLPAYAPQASAQLAGTLPVMQRNLMRMYRAGVPIVMGTDAGNIGTLHAVSVPAEMEAMAAAGMPPRAVLASATIAPARMLGAARDLGSVTRGKVADLVLLREDPRRNIAAVAKIDTVIRNGHVVAAAAAEAVVQRQLEAYNAWNADAFAATYADDVALHELGLGEAKPFLEGGGALRREYAGFFAAAKPKVEILQRILAGRFVVDHEKGDFGGKAVEAGAVYLVEDGRIRRVWFADAGLKGGDAANAVRIADAARTARGEAAVALHARDHLLAPLSVEPAPWNAVRLPEEGPSARIVAGPFVIDHHEPGEMLVVRLIKEGRVARTWVGTGEPGH